MTWTSTSLADVNTMLEAHSSDSLCGGLITWACDCVDSLIYLADHDEAVFDSQPATYQGHRLAAVLEMIKAQYLEVNDPLQGAILPATQFDALRQDLVNAIEGVATRYSVARTCRSAMRRKAGELNRHPFRDVMQNMCRHLDMALQGDELRQIAAIRNSLIHEGRFSSAASQGPRLEPVEAWRILVSFVDRVLLRLVDYRGPYRDFRSESIQTL